MKAHRFLGQTCLSAMVWMTICSAASAQAVSPQEPAKAPPPGAPATPPGATPVTEVATPPVGPAAPTQPQQEIVITGTSIRGVAPVGANLLSVGQAQIQSTPAQSVQQILTSIPAVNGLGVAGQGGFQSNDQSGANIPSIHGLGGSSSTSTLSLIDGHRIPLTGTWHSLGDPNMVPPNAIERVEVLTGGASSIYGSDAVAGVINFVTRRSFEGIEASAQAGFGDHYRTRNANLIAGTKWDSGSVYFAYNYSYRSDLLAADRPYTQANHTAQGGSNLASFSCAPASIQPAGSSLIYGYPYDGAGVTSAQANAFCDASGYADLLPSETRNQGFVKAIQHVGSRLTVEADALFSDRVNRQILSRGSITGTIFGPGSGRGSQINPFYQFMPGSTATSETVRMNFDELLGPGAHASTGDQDFYFHTNLAYNINNNWTLTADGIVGTDYSYYRNIGRVCSSCANLALNGTTNGSGNLTTPSIPASGVIVTQPLTTADALDPYNLAAGNLTSPAVLAALRDSLDETTSRQTIKDLKLQLGGDLFNLPAGAVKVSVGAEGVIYSLYSEKYSPLNIGPSSTGTAEGQFPFPDRKVTSAYGEALIPIVSPEMGIPAVRSLTVDISGRYDHYSDFGSTTNPRLAANWEVMRGLKLRGDFSRSFVAPQVVFQGINGQGLNVESGYGTSTSVVGLPVSAFPEAAQLPGCANVSVCTIGTSITGLQLNGGQPLKPEKGKTYSFGADFTPAFIPGLRLSATYWYNEIHGGITAPTQSLAIGTPSLYSRFHFFPNGATPEQIAAIVGAVPQTSAIPPKVYYIYDFRIGNVLNLFVGGLDVDMNYSFDTHFGRITLGNMFTKLLKFDQQTGNGGRFSVLNTSGFNSTFPSISLVGRAHAGWKFGDFSFDGYANYTGAHRNWSGNTVTPLIRDSAGNPTGGGDRVRANVTFDAHLAYTLPNALGKSQVFLDVQNLFNKPPAFFNSPNGYDPFSGNPIGRLVTIGIRAKY